MNVLVAAATSLGLVTIYYLLWAMAAISVQKYFHYDKPQGLFYKVIDIPIVLPYLIFDLAVPMKLKRAYFNFKSGYLRKAALCFMLNVALYFIPFYFLVSR
jgi:hypothetical protein